jgi:competence protein ComGC
MLKKNKGFTLVEVIIVIASIVILAMVIIPIVLGLYQEFSSNELTVQTEETKVVEQPNITIKEPTENKIEKKDLEKL